MKVLWLTSRPLPAVFGDGRAGEGWIENLRRAFEATLPETHLHIVSWGGPPHEPFTRDNATYYSTANATSRTPAERLVRRWRHGVVPSDRVAKTAAVVAGVAPDIVHVHGSESFLGLALQRVDARAVISLQGIATAYEPYMLSALPPSALLRDVASRAFLEGWGVVHDNARFKARAAAERAALGFCSDFIGRTDWDRSVLEALRPDARYYHVDEVLSPAFYEAEWRSEALADRTLLCVASASPVKGIEVLLQALSILRHEWAVPARLRIASPGDGAGVWRYWRGLIDDLGLQDGVTVLGGLKSVEVADELTRASLFVHPSHIDNSPNSLCEAMLVGVPCVASFVGGVPSLVEHGRTALLYPDRDPYLLAANIRKALADADLAGRLGQAARDVAQVRHDPGTIARRTCQVYEEIVGRDAGARGGDAL